VNIGDIFIVVAHQASRMALVSGRCDENISGVVQKMTSGVYQPLALRP